MSPTNTTANLSASSLCQVANGFDTFQLFGRLPVELRLMIWQSAMDESRVVVISCKSSISFLTGLGDRHILPVPIFKVKVSSTTVATLHVNRESRAEALKSYQPLFGNQLADKPVYFNPSRDTLFMADGKAISAFYHTFSPEEFYLDVQQVVRHLAVGGSLDGESQMKVEGFMNLKTLALQKDVWPIHQEWIKQDLRKCWYKRQLSECLAERSGDGSWEEAKKLAKSRMPKLVFLSEEKIRHARDLRSAKYLLAGKI